VDDPGPGAGEPGASAAPWFGTLFGGTGLDVLHLAGDGGPAEPVEVAPDCSTT
jgi:hypothetical protein